MNKIIYADNAATTRLDQDAYSAMLPFLQEEYGNASNTYSFSRIPKKAIEEARQIIAGCINATEEEIVFTSGGTEGANWAIKGVALKHSDKGKHVITSNFEHHAVLHSCSFLEELGYEITYIPVEENGHVSVEEIKKSILPTTTIISIMLANNEIGTIQDISGISKIISNGRTILHSDATQAIGHIKVDVKDLGIDVLSASAHKFNGPKGIGFIYLKKGTVLYNWISGGKQENDRRAGTENVASIVGMAVALKNNCKKLTESTLYLNTLSNIFLEMLNGSDIDFVINGDQNRLPGNINISIKDNDGEAIMHRLDLKNIIISTGSACTSGKKTISHVIKAIGTPKEYAEGTIRITLSKENTIEEVYTIGKAIISIVSTK